MNITRPNRSQEELINTFQLTENELICPDCELIMTVREILETEGFRSCHVIAGQAGLNRVVRKITVLELEDAMEWIEGGELVCSTGYLFAQSTKAQSEWIEKMANKNASALVIKPQRYLGVTPPLMIQKAEECKLPLIELPMTALWPSIIAGVMNSMLLKQTERLIRSYKIHVELENLVLSSQGLDSIVRSISNYINLPVIVLDSLFNTIYGCYPQNHPDYEQYLKEIVHNREFRQTLSSHLHVDSSVKKNLSQSFSLSMNISGRLIALKMVPIAADRQILGWLVVVIIDKEEPYFVQTVIAQAVSALALELLMKTIQFQSKSKGRADFLETLINDTLTPSSEIRKISGIMGINITDPISVMLIQTNPSVTPLSFRSLQNALNTNSFKNEIFYSDAKITVFFYSKEYTNHDKTKKELMDTANSILKNLEYEGYNCHIGISKCRQGFRMIRNSYREAMQCLDKAQRVNKKVITHEELGMEKMFLLFRDQDTLTEYRNSMLQKLLNQEYKNINLLGTLLSYLRNNCNQNLTAQSLHIHINTLKYRLTKIKEILNVDLEDMETCSMLYLALKILECQSNKEETGNL